MPRLGTKQTPITPIAHLATVSTMMTSADEGKGDLAGGAVWGLAVGNPGWGFWNKATEY